MLNDTLVVWTSEFDRSPGRKTQPCDHNPQDLPRG